MVAFYDIQHSALENFNLKAKSIIEGYYLTPYPANPLRKYQRPLRKQNPRDGHLERTCHGAMHASRVAAYTQYFHALQKKYDPSIDANLNQLATSMNTTPETLLKLTQYAALFHDSARQDDGVDLWDAQSAENGRRYLAGAGVPNYMAEAFAAAAEHKDDFVNFRTAVDSINQKYHLNINVQQMNYLRTLIADSDCLDIIRVRSNFDLKYLNVYKKFKANPDAYQDIIKHAKMAAAVIEYQKDGYHAVNLNENGQYVCNLISKVTININEKIKYEQAPDPYAKTVGVLSLPEIKAHLNSTKIEKPQTFNEKYIAPVMSTIKKGDNLKYIGFALMAASAIVYLTVSSPAIAFTALCVGVMTSITMGLSLAMRKWKQSSNSHVQPQPSNNQNSSPSARYELNKTPKVVKFSNRVEGGSEVTRVTPTRVSKLKR